MFEANQERSYGREERWHVNLRGFAINASRDADIFLTDLSYRGCQIQSSENFVPGERLELRVMRRGIVEAEVRWAKNGIAGAQFVD